MNYIKLNLVYVACFSVLKLTLIFNLSLILAASRDSQYAISLNWMSIRISLLETVALVLVFMLSSFVYLHQVSRSIGDAYLKRPEFSLDPSFPRFHLPEPIRRPVLTAEPSICTRVLQPNDKFLIFASDGLWEHLTNQEAVDIVYNCPRAVCIIFKCIWFMFCLFSSLYSLVFDIFFSFKCQGVARRLLKTALNAAAKKRQMDYDELKKIDKGDRRFYHDDITVVVIFIDHELLGNKISVPGLSVRGFVDTVGPSNFNILQN